MTSSDLTSNPGRTVLFGAAPDTGNLGVEALARSVLEGMQTHAEHPSLAIFDNGLGHRHATMSVAGKHIDYELLGARLSRRWYRPESLQTMNALAQLRGVGNFGVRAIRRSPAVLDVSGGDSFTDMYGPKRFRSIVLPKKIALKMRRPLVLLPQTYGPFRSQEAKAEAEDILRRADQVWARDAVSFDRLASILGHDLDKSRHRLGVDMAFGLSPTEPDSVPAARCKAWLAIDERPIAGVNVSGLLWNGAPAGTTRDKLRVDYRALIRTLVKRLVSDGARVLLVPHVVGTRKGSESDELAIAELVQNLGLRTPDLEVVPTDLMTANEVKWWISRCAWFTGARMHSTIAALSSSVPTAALAYSVKTGPVFASVGLEDQVVDARIQTTDQTLEFLWHAWTEREATRQLLEGELESVRKIAREQMIEIARTCDSLRGTA